jgi:hypothetical protein
VVDSLSAIAGGGGAVIACGSADGLGKTVTVSAGRVAAARGGGWGDRTAGSGGTGGRNGLNGVKM